MSQTKELCSYLNNTGTFVCLVIVENPLKEEKKKIKKKDLSCASFGR